MTRTALPRDVDLRAFSWSGSRLRLQLEVVAQRATARLAARERQRAESEARLQATKATHQADLVRAQGHSGVADVAQRHRDLLHLSFAWSRVQEDMAVAAESGRRVDAARKDHVAAQRRLDCLDRLEQMALAAFAGEQRRRAATEADRAWLARNACVRARRREESGA